MYFFVKYLIVRVLWFGGFRNIKMQLLLLGVMDHLVGLNLEKLYRLFDMLRHKEYLMLLIMVLLGMRCLCE